MWIIFAALPKETNGNAVQSNVPCSMGWIRFFTHQSLLISLIDRNQHLLKKLLKGDATWDIRKLIIGRLIDTIRGAIELPPHRIARLHEILNKISPNQKVIAVKEWQNVLGEYIRCQWQFLEQAAVSLYSKTRFATLKRIVHGYA